jgi:hypothetical protein
MRLLRKHMLKAQQANSLQPVLGTLKYNMHANTVLLDTIILTKSNPKQHKLGRTA